VSLRRAFRRLAAEIAGRRLDRELDDEIAAHLELLERDALARGCAPDEARLAARRAFGSELRVREDHRRSRGIGWLDQWRNDLRHAAAGLVRQPRFTVAAASVLALGIGASSAVFGLVDAVLLAPLPFPDAARIVRVWETPAADATSPTTTATFLALSTRSRAFAALSAESPSTAAVDVDGRTVRWTGRYVSAAHFDVFGVRPALGRAFREEEDRPGVAPVLVISHATWQQWFGGRPDVLGRVLRLDGVPHEVIGVLPPGPFDRDRARPLEAPASFWRLNQFSDDEIRWPAHWLRPVGRLAPGVSAAQALADVRRVRAEIAGDLPAWKRTWNVTLEPFARQLTGGRLEQALLASLGGVTLLLLLASASVANLLVARNAARHRELAVRRALGASRGRLAAQLLAECLLLSAVGAAGGVAVAYASLALALPVLPPMPFTADIGVHAQTLLIAAALSLVVVAVAGAVPGVTERPSSGALHGGTRGATRADVGLRRAIATAQVAVSVVLVCGAVLLGQSLRRLQAVDTGIRTADVLVMAIELPRDRYATRGRLTTFYAAAVGRLRSVPGVRSASVSSDVPLDGTGSERLRVPGRDGEQLVRFKRVDASYFDTLGIPLAAGRPFGSDDRADTAPVTIVNETLADLLRRSFGVNDVVGSGIELPVSGFAGRRTEMRVVGVVGDERVGGDLRAPAEPVAYVTLAQQPRLQVTLLVHGENAAARFPAIRDALREIDPMLAPADVRTMEQIWHTSLSGLRGPTWLAGTFAAAAVVIAALGLYGILAHAVERRRREIGIRLALGARPRTVAAAIAAEALALVGTGLVLGGLGAAASTRLLGGILFQVSATDPGAFAAAGVIVGAICVAVAVTPLRRSTRIDPAITLRADG
jgi:predicted permease